MEKTVERAQQMIRDLLRAGFSGKDISQGSGVNPNTIGSLRNGKSTRVTDKVFDRIWDYWSEHAPPKDDNRPPDEEETPVAIKNKSISEAARKSLRKAAEGTNGDAVAKTKEAPAPRQRHPEASSGSFVSRQHVPVDISALTAVIRRLVSRFEDAKRELEEIRKEIQ